ncbi:MAG TPA: phosphatase [Candidatus Synoicihabitans sp.]|nr:phosphatase [Candidatus Synoicihabitans sp.]
MTPPVAVIDIGSNSIKVLVAGREANGRLRALAMKTLDARISTGISHTEPRLSEDGMQRGVAAVHELLLFAASHHPARVMLVATSAVRGAVNGAEFRERVATATGQTIRILTGDEEANLIGRGLTADPALVDLQDFYVFDLGGGSLECLSFRDRRIQQAESFPLGCVRLTERLATDSRTPFTASDDLAIAAHVRAVMAPSAFRFDLGPNAPAVFAGGSMTTTRLILGAEANLPLEATSPRVAVAELRRLLFEVGRLPLAQRKQVPGLPAARADIYPTALATMIAIADLGRFDAYQHSLYNLRWGVADEALA